MKKSFLGFSLLLGIAIAASQKSASAQEVFPGMFDCVDAAMNTGNVLPGSNYNVQVKFNYDPRSIAGANCTVEVHAYYSSNTGAGESLPTVPRVNSQGDVTTTPVQMTAPNVTAPTSLLVEVTLYDENHNEMDSCYFYFNVTPP